MLLAPAMALVFLVFSAFSATDAYAEKRVALVVGNGDYKHTSQLMNPVNDAELVEKSLRAVGFEIVAVADGSHKDMLAAMSQFGRLSQGAEVTLFFYAGHGLEVAGRNWLLPVDANIENSSDLPSAAVKVDDVLELMELSEARIRLVVLDACRNNPLPRSLTRSSTKGLAKIDASAAGTMVVFSAAPGEVALDGSGANSPFSDALAKHLTAPGIEVRQMIGRVRQDVLAATNNKQVPWVNEAIAGDFYLAGKDAEAIAEKPEQQPIADTDRSNSGPSGALSVELAFWDSVKDSGNKELIELYLRKYPDGSFRDLAEVLLAALETEASAPRASQGEQQEALPKAKEGSSATLEQRTRDFVLKFNSSMSADAQVVFEAVREFYAGQVDFYGKQFDNEAIAQDKANLVARWPKRNYQAPNDEMAIECYSDANVCDVNSIVYWNVASAERNKTASGVSQTILRVDFNSGQPKITFEHSQALKR
jgi:uncharacterized caspase-like protein